MFNILFSRITTQNAQWNNTNGQWHGTYKDQKNRNVETYYNNNGERIDTHTSYNQEELPSRVRERANKKYHSTQQNSIAIAPN